MGTAEVDLFLDGNPVDGSEMYGDTPYHHVVCMMVYVCHNTANFYRVFYEKLRFLDDRYGDLQVFVPSCAPEISHIIYFVQFLKKLNPGAEIFFDTDDLPSFVSMATARFSLIVIVSGWDGATGDEVSLGKAFSERLHKEESERLELLKKADMESLRLWEEKVYAERKALLDERVAVSQKESHADSRYRVAILRKGVRYIVEGIKWHREDPIEMDMATGKEQDSV